MPRPWRIRYAGAKYHVCSRGNGRQRIFLEADDRVRFMEQLESALQKDEVILYAFVLMTNHYHLFCETPLGNIQRFMQRLNTAYSMYFRYKHARPGHCFQGRYQAKLVSGDDYVLRVTRYIHLNPVETEKMKGRRMDVRKRYLAQYPWSSCRGYIDEKARSDLIDYRWLKLMGRKTDRGRRAAYRRYLEGMIGKPDEVLNEALKASRCAIGDKAFIRETESDLKEMRMAGALRGDLLAPDPRILSIEDVMAVMVTEQGVSIEAMRRHGRKAGLDKAIAIELCCRFTPCTQRQVAKFFGYVEDSPITRQRSKLRVALGENQELSKRVACLSKKLAEAE